MARKKTKGGRDAAGSSDTTNAFAVGDGIYLDPVRIRFQHSKIRPVFSGCGGRSVKGTLQEIRDGKTQVSDLPPVQVLMRPEEQEDGQKWYFSLNNRRVWVLKRLREEGLLEQYDNKVFVRVCAPKSSQERERYSVKNCALEAKIIPENNRGKGKNRSKPKSDTNKDDKVEEAETSSPALRAPTKATENAVNEDDSDEDDSEDDDSATGRSASRFGVLLV
jgi:hypothetical protein